MKNLKLTNPRIYLTLWVLLIPLWASAQLTSGLILHYDLNGDANDSSTYNNQGVLNNTSTTPDRFGVLDSALHFSGVSSINLPNNASLKPPLPVTIALYVKMDNFNQTQPLFHSEVLAHDYVGYFVNVAPSGQIMAHIGGNMGNSGPGNRRSYLSTNTISIGTWHSVVVIINAYNNMRIFIDCIESPGTYSGTGSTTMIYANTAGKVGEGASNPNFPSGFFLSGALDQLRVWDRSLSPSEILNVCDDLLLPLPVEVYSFEGEIQKGQAYLSWQTNSELNNDGFYVQHSTNGLNWENLSFIKGQGSTEGVNHYQYMHERPFEENYYRLKQVDMNGAFEYSTVIHLSVNKENQIEIYPNPTRGKIEIKGAKVVRIKIIDRLGKIVKEQFSTDPQIDISALVNGIYFMTVTTEEGVITQRIIKK